jgi:hypothetical protein
VKHPLSDALDADVRRARAIVDSIKPLLTGHGPGVQGAALMELLALFIAGHAPDDRERLLTLHVQQVRAMLPIVDHELFGSAGHPAARDV